MDDNKDKKYLDTGDTSKNMDPGAAGDLQRYARHVSRALESIHGYAILTLDRDGLVTSWNAGAESTKGYTRDEIVGKSFTLFYSEADRAARVPEKALEAALFSGRHEMEGWRFRKSGERFWANVIIEPIFDESGDFQGFVKVTRDISHRLETERLREELHQSQKLEVLGQLTGGIAHDFNNLLTAIKAGNELIKSYTLDARVDRVLDLNRVALDRGKKLISQLMAFSRKQVLNPKISKINDLILVFEDLIRASVGAAIDLQCVLDRNLPSVDIDQGQFQSALLNLIVNARDALGREGAITIFTEEVTLAADNFDAPHNVDAGRYVVVGVRDTGPGMSDAVRTRAIEPFFTTKEVGKGTGLGLSQAFGFARQSNGTLTIESEESKGTTVRILLPVSAVAVALDPATSHRTILVVDDDEAVRTLTSELFRMLGHTVLEAEDARDALDQIQKNMSIDCVFSDIVMPGMNGVELLANIRSSRPEIQGVLASGFSRDHLRDTAQLPENVRFVQKPFSPAVLETLFTGSTPAVHHGLH